jgi:glycosyltransferase involved in cell wall biosynthesis
LELKTMRVLQIIDSLNLGGAEVMLTAMAPRFRTRGVDCDVVVLLRSQSPLERTFREQNVTLYYTDVPRLYSPRQIFSLTKFLNGYDIIHVHLFPAQLWAVLAAASLGTRVPLVTTEHSTSNERRRWCMRRFDKWMYSRYQHIACISEATAEELVRWCPTTAGKISVIPNGIRLDAFEMARPAELPDVPKNVARLVFVGRIDPQKDHATILRALVSLKNKAHLILVGDGPERLRMEALARSLGIREQVTFLGRRSDVAAVLKASDIYVHSTNFEGFGISACEAMAAGLPVVASDVPGLAQLVAGAGLLFPVGDDKALAQHLTSLIESPELRREMSQAGVRRARQFSVENTVDGCIRMYQSVLQVGAASTIAVVP